MSWFEDKATVGKVVSLINVGDGDSTPSLPNASSWEMVSI